MTSSAARLNSVFLVTLLIGLPNSATSQSRAEPQKAPLAPGDQVAITIWLDSTSTNKLRVDHSMRVMLPRVGPVSLAGVPAEAIADSVRSAYRSVLKTTSIEVTPLRRVSVLGDVRKPDVYYVDLTTTLRDAVAHAGGVAEIGRPDQVSLVRDGVRTRVADWESASSVWAPLLSGDEILVARQSFVERNAVGLITALAVLVSVVFTIAHK